MFPSHDRKGCILLEPFGRNTAPALTLAALAAMREGDDPVLLVMPSDHVIIDVESFQTAVLSGMSQAINGSIVTFGITPDAPETGYGYIQSGDLIGPDGAAVHHIARFVEKPDRVTAQTYLDEGNYLWNSGLFMMRASIWLSAIAKCRPDILAACRAAWEQGSADGEFLRIDKQAFEQCPSDSIDYAVMEKIVCGNSELPAGVVIPLTAGWSDIGAWSSLRLS